MKKGVSIWCFPTGTPLPEAMTKAKAAGFDSLEIALGEKEQLDIRVTDAQARALRRRANGLGLELPSVVSQGVWVSTLITRDAKDYARAKALTRASLRVARLLGARTLLVVPGVVSAEMPYDEAYDRCRDALCEMAPEAEQAGVILGLENVWNKFLLSPLEMVRLIDEVASPFVGVFFDVGNVLVYGFPEQWIRILGSRIKHVHVKDFVTSIGNIHGFCGLLDGNVNWPAVIGELQKAGYDGHLTAEVGPVHPVFPDFLLTKTGLALDAILSLQRPAATGGRAASQRTTRRSLGQGQRG